MHGHSRKQLASTEPIPCSLHEPAFFWRGRKKSAKTKFAKRTQQLIENRFANCCLNSRTPSFDLVDWAVASHRLRSRGKRTQEWQINTSGVAARLALHFAGNSAPQPKYEHLITARACYSCAALFSGRTRRVSTKPTARPVASTSRGVSYM